MQVRPVDPRDTFWEVRVPTFRVYFWDRPLSPDDESGRTSYEYEVTEADIHTVLDWAEQKAGSGFTYTAYLLLDCPEQDKGMIKLAGRDPTDPSEPHGAGMPERPRSVADI